MDRTGFSATHAIPDEGLPAWDAPDAGRTPVTTLGAQLPVRVAGAEGDWARVVCSNGWTGWVDGRRLVAVASGPTPPDRSRRHRDARRLGRVLRGARGVTLAGVRTLRTDPAGTGAVVVAVGAVLGWVRGSGILAANAFDIPLLFLFGVRTTWFRGLSVGLLLLGLAAAGYWGVRARDRARGRLLSRSAGVASVVLAVWFVLRVSLPREGVPIGRIGYGAWAVMIGGALLALGRSPDDR